MLIELVPKIKRIAVIQNPNNAVSGVYLTAIDEAVRARRVNLMVLDVRSGDQLDSAFKQAARWAQGVIVIQETLVRNNRGQITALAARHRLPAVYGSHEFVRAGGLMAYGPSSHHFGTRRGIGGQDPERHAPRRHSC
jgi:putative ABC transport system substrate-binding protein